MEKNSIIGKLYYKLKSKEFLNFKNQSEFFVFLGVEPNLAEEYVYSNTYTVSNFINYDYYDPESNLINLEKLRKGFDFGVISIEKEKEINSKLCEIIGSNIAYTEKNERDKTKIKLVCYSEKDKQKLLMYYKLKEDCFDLSYNLYLILHLALYKKFPEGFYYGVNYEKALSEFNEEVIKLYGATSEPSTRAILYLANKEIPNIFAVYEKAEMFYYGNREYIEKDIVKAYEIYKIAAGFYTINFTKGNEDKTICHPLALWTLSYILLNYKKEKTELEYCESIYELDEMSQLNRIKRAIVYAQASYDFIENGPSANILGKIALIKEEELPGISVVRQEYNMKTPDEYFENAAKKGYVYAINNMGLCECEKIFSDIDNKDEHLVKALEYFENSAERFEPWACNYLGEIYRTGVIKSRNREEEILIEKILDKRKAYDCYMKAISCFINKNSAWAYFNLIVYYPNKIIEEDKLIEYVHKIRKIGNKAAIEKLKLKWPEEYALKYEEIE